MRLNLGDKIIYSTGKHNSIVRGKFLEGENFGEFGKWHTIHQIFLANIYKYSGITDRLPADLPKFSSSIASSVMIHQNFPFKFFPCLVHNTLIEQSYNERVV